MKECTKCNIIKSLIDFPKRESSKDGFRNECKLCLKDYRKKYRENNKERLSNQNKIYRKENKEKLSKQKKEYYNNHKEEAYNSNKKNKALNKEKVKIYMKNYTKTYVKENREKIKTYRQNYNLVNKEKISGQTKLYREQNQENIKAYNLQNKDKINKLKNIYNKNKRKTDPTYRIVCLVRGRINTFLKNSNYTKKSKSFEMIGCSPEELRTHIEKQFTEGMSWDLMGKIHIDHIIPLATAKSEEDVLKLCHYTNLQPLWARDNLVKGSSQT